MAIREKSFQNFTFTLVALRHPDALLRQNVILLYNRVCRVLRLRACEPASLRACEPASLRACEPASLRASRAPGCNTTASWHTTTPSRHPGRVSGHPGTATGCHPWRVKLTIESGQSDRAPVATWFKTQLPPRIIKAQDERYKTGSLGRKYKVKGASSKMHSTIRLSPESDIRWVKTPPKFHES